MRAGRTFFLLLFFGLLVTAATATFSYKYLKAWGTSTIELTQPIDIRVPRGVTLKQLSHIFEDQQLVSNALFFEYWVRLFSNYRNFQAGRYLFHSPLSPRDVATTIIKGEIYQPVVYSLTVPEGYTVAQVRERLLADNITSEEEFHRLNTDKDFLKALRVPSTSLEGFLYPATYNFIVLPEAREVIKKMVRTFWKELPKDYLTDISEKELSLHDAVTFASLIERETGRPDERGAVSEVIWRRLKRGIPLAIDASLIYGIQDFDGNIRRKHLKDKGNPYNTRIHPGLPPSPICSPSKASLKAVLQPTDMGYMYYVVEDIQTRKHHFSKTLKEHNTYVRKFVRQGG